MPCFLFVSECAPSSSIHIILDRREHYFVDSLRVSGFVCTIQPKNYERWNTRFKCSFCKAGTKSTAFDNCLKCPAGKEMLHCRDTDYSGD